MYWIRIKNKSTNVFLLAMLLIICSLAQAAIEPHPLFCEGMVLQRNKSVPVWGWADPGEKVTVRFGDATTTVTANAKGKWGLRLPAMPASSQPRTMVVSGAGGSRVEIADVLVGEVWLCGGQSNMEVGVNDAMNAKQEQQDAKFPRIRMATVGWSLKPTPQDRPTIHGNRWKPAVAEHILGLSAMGYFFGRELYRELSELRLAQNNNISASRFHETGIRFTGDNCVFRNSVVSHAAGSGVIATGKNFVMENNYLRDIDYQGTFAAGIVTTHFSTEAKILRNTFWRTGRSALHMLGPHQEVGYNDWSEFTKLNVDGGGNYSQARWNHGPEPTTYRMGNNLLGGLPWDGTSSHQFEGLVFHHNWCHDSGAYEDGHALGAGIYFDDTTDGAIIHHNVCWNCTFVDMRAPNGRLDVKKTPLGLHFIHNNTFATPEGGTPEQELRMMGPANCQISGQYKQAPHSIDNNIYAARQGIHRKGVDYRIKPTEISIGLEPFDASAVFVDPSGKSGGLGFQLKASSPAINRGVSINASNITDSTGATIDYVDGPFNGPAPDCGAYEFGKEAWVPGCTLDREFIEGQPWERQWGTKRKF